MHHVNKDLGPLNINIPSQQLHNSGLTGLAAFYRQRGLLRQEAESTRKEH